MTAPKLNSKTGGNTSASDLIRLEIETSGPISFARFMALALYAPGVGYYESPRPVTGRHGDFMTSVSVGKVFGELIGFYCAEEMGRMRESSQPDLRARADHAPPARVPPLGGPHLSCLKPRPPKGGTLAGGSWSQLAPRF